MAKKATAKPDPYAILFEGRTLCIEAVFSTPLDPRVLGERVRKAIAGPKFRLTAGGLLHGRDVFTYVAKTFINTDESDLELAMRVKALDPAPTVVTVGEVARDEAIELWKSVREHLEGN